MDSSGLPVRSVMASITLIFLATSYKLLPAIISKYVLLDKMSVLFSPTEEEYDFIIVGAGSSGSLLSNRLSAFFTVLLLEAGGLPFPLQNVPVLAPLMLGHKDLDWSYFTVPQKYSCLSLVNKTSFWPRGKGLGGSSLLNFLAWNRGHPLDYDNWAEITGDRRWSYESLLPFFKRSESFLGKGNNANNLNKDEYHGYNGEIPVSPIAYKPLVTYFLEAAKELGYPITDLNAPFDEGFNEHCFNARRGQRVSSYEAFLRPILPVRSDRLKIQKFSIVTKALINNKYQAFGVEYKFKGKLYTARARREVILSAGAISSPTILMHSGIGPANHLQKFGIEPIVNLPGVGRNLQDHVSALVGPFTINKNENQPPRATKHLTYIPNRDSRLNNVLQYLSSGEGPLAQSGSMASGFIIMNKTENIQKPWPDIQLLLLGIPQDDEGLLTLAKAFNIEINTVNKYYGPSVNKDSFSIMVIVSRPKSRGRIQLSSSYPFDFPLIDPNYFDHPDDMNLLLKGIRKAVQLVEETKSFAKIGARLQENNVFPGCEKFPFKSDEYWECFARHLTISVFHPSGTCSMGNGKDPETVIDSSLKVLGVSGLRVVDASVMPRIVSSNINPACTVIGERGADIILGEHIHEIHSKE